jgi:hypothetical protein
MGAKHKFRPQRCCRARCANWPGSRELALHRSKFKLCNNSKRDHFEDSSWGGFWQARSALLTVVVATCEYAMVQLVAQAGSQKIDKSMHVLNQ